MSNYTHYNVWYGITYPFPNFNGATVEVWEWISNFISHFTHRACDYLSMLGFKLYHVDKRGPLISTVAFCIKGSSGSLPVYIFPQDFNPSRPSNPIWHHRSLSLGAFCWCQASIIGDIWSFAPLGTKVESKHNTFHSIKCVRKCKQNVGHFVQASIFRPLIEVVSHMMASLIC